MKKGVNLAAIQKIMLGCVLFLSCLLAATYFFRDNIFQNIQDPGQPFQTYTPPTAPNYINMEAWLAQPDLGEDPYTNTAKGDVFVVVPSVYRGGAHWNLPSDDLKRKNKLQRIVRPNYVSPYGQAGRLFAPYYRQASLYAFMTSREDAVQAQDFAYQDVKRAFQSFLKNSPPERPIVLVGHNQGASHVQRLLMDFFQGELKNRLAVAYVIDYPLPLDAFEGSLSSLKTCETEKDTGCIVAFGTFTPKDRVIADRYTNRLLVHDGSHYKAIAGRNIACMNPLVWQSHEDYVPRRLHKGGVAAEGLEPDIDPAPLTKQVGAQCQNGLLLVDKPRSRSLRRPIQVGAKFRTLPSNLFYEDLKQNAVMRVNMMLEGNSLPKRTGKLDGFDVIDVVESRIGTVKEALPGSVIQGNTASTSNGSLIISVQTPFKSHFHADGGATAPKLIITGFSDEGVFKNKIKISIEDMPNLSMKESSFSIRDIKKRRNINVKNLATYDETTNSFNFDTAAILSEITSTPSHSSEFSFSSELKQDKTSLGGAYWFFFTVKKPN